MAFELIISVNARSGQNIGEYLQAVARDGAKDIGLEWSDPEKAVGISEHLYATLGTIGALSLPVSIFASVLANEISRFIYGVQEHAESDDRITFTMADMDSGKMLKIEFSSRDQVVAEVVAEKIRGFLD